MQTKKVYLTAENTILIVTASTDGTGEKNRYVSVTAHEIKPLSIDDAKKRNREMLEDGELWRMAVNNYQTELGLSEWVESVINTDGDISCIDNSLYTDMVDIDGVQYIFESLSCGCMHDEINAATNEFNTLISLHLSKDIEQADKIIGSILSDNVDDKVYQYAKQIVLNN